MKEIISARDEYVESVKTYIKNKLPLWKTMPYLVLCNQGVSGFSDNAVHSFRGYFPLFGSKHRDLFVDCDSGELCVFSYGDEKYIIIPANKVMNITIDDLERTENYYFPVSNLDALDTGGKHYDNQYWRYTVAKKYHITPIYQRHENSKFKLEYRY